MSIKCTIINRGGVMRAAGMQNVKLSDLYLFMFQLSKSEAPKELLLRMHAQLNSLSNLDVHETMVSIQI